MREVGRRLKISHSTISRYKANIYQKENWYKQKYEIFIKYLFDHYDRKVCSIEICVYKFKKSHVFAKCPSVKQVYNWINEGKIFLSKRKIML